MTKHDQRYCGSTQKPRPGVRHIMRKLCPTGSSKRLLQPVLLAVVVLGMTVAPAEALAQQTCTNEQARVRQAEYDGYASHLPDCRAYEQVSPVDKNTTDVQGRPGFVESSPLGSSVSYYSIVPFPTAVGSSEFPVYVSMRGEAEWSTQSLLPLTEAAVSAEVLALTNNGDETVVYVSRENGLLLAPGAAPHKGNLYLHNNLTGEYRLIAPGVHDVKVASSTRNGAYILFSAILGEEQELGGVTDPNFVPYVFEWSRATGQDTLVGVVEGVAPEAGALAGPSEFEGEGNPNPAYAQSALSEDGSRVFFSELTGGTEKVYMREPAAERTTEVSLGPAQWRAATPTGAKVFYTEGGNLYVYDVETKTHTTIAEGAGVLGLLGISSDGAYAYFTAEGILAANENGAHEKAAIGSNDANLYEWHEGAATPITFFATLSTHLDSSGWEGFSTDEPGGPDQGYKSSRVGPSGTTLLISSLNQLTSYPNEGFNEIYLYDATKPLSSSNPRCVSCGPVGTPARTSAYLAHDNLNSAPAAPIAIEARNLSAGGTRVFFQTAEPLLAQASNGQENVYEWEREGTGSCQTELGTDNGGCLYLISTGQSTGPSYFGNASEDGESAFFFTRQSLVSQDQDENVDAYDAREDGGLESQDTTPSETCEGEQCRGALSSAPVLGVPASSVGVGMGNLTPTPEPGSPKPLTRKQKLRRARRRCEAKPRHQRAACLRAADGRYARKTNKGHRKDGR